MWSEPEYFAFELYRKDGKEDCLLPKGKEVLEVCTWEEKIVDILSFKLCFI